MIVYIYNIGVDLYNGFNGLRHRINWTYFSVLDGLAHPLYSRKLNTDCKTTYNILKNRIEVIDYDNDNHRLYFLNKIISNLNSQFIDRFHGVTKRMLPLYYSEFEWRFNHRNCKSIMDKIKNYIMQSSIAARKMIRDSMDQYATARGLENA